MDSGLCSDTDFINGKIMPQKIIVTYTPNLALGKYWNSMYLVAVCYQTLFFFIDYPF